MLYRHVPTEAIPQCLRERPQWICWKYVPRENGEPGKLPVQAEKGWNASTTDANTWSTFDVAVQAYQKNKAYAGIAYVFAESDPFAGIDLDDCLDDDGEFIWGLDIVETFDTYSEVSPSGRGIKLIFEGKKPQSAGCIVKGLGPDGNGQIEIYDRARCFTITGQRLVSSPTGVANRQLELDALCAKLWPDKRNPPKPTPPVEKQAPTEAKQKSLERMRACNGALKYYPTEDEIRAKCELLRQTNNWQGAYRRAPRGGKHSVPETKGL